MAQPNRSFTTTRYPESLESLDSLLNWLSARNGPYPQRWYDSIFERRQANINLLRAEGDFEALARLTNLDARVLRRATLHRFAWRYYTPKELNRLRRAGEADDYGSVLWEARLAQLFIRPTRKPQVCPRCWAANPILLLPWCLRHVTTCPTHRVLLVDVCPSCAKDLKIDFEKSCCAHCSTPIADFPTQGIAGDPASHLLTRLVCGALGLHSRLSHQGRDSSALQALYEAPGHPLTQMQPSFLLRFLWRLGEVLVANDPQGPLFGPAAWQPAPLRAYLYEGTDDALVNQRAVARPLSHNTARTHRILSGVCRLFLDWPVNWHGTLSRLAALEYASGRTSYRRFPVILKRKFGTPEYSWLVDAWLDYMQANMQHNLDLQPWVFYYRDARVRKGDVAEVLSVKQAAGLLGMTADNVMEFVDKGLIEATQAHMGPSPGPGQRVFVGTNTPGVTKRPRRVTLIDIDAVNRLNQIRASQVSLTAVAHRLGVGEAVIRDIVRVGLLLTERKYDRRRRGVRLDDLEAFLSRLSENSIPLHRPADVPNLLTIDRARQQVSYHKLSIARMLDAVMRGVLPAYRLPAASGEDTAPRDKGLRSIGDLLFKLDDVRAFVAAEPLPEGRELLSRGLVRQVLKCNHSALTTFEATGLLVPVEQDPETPKSLWRYDNLDVELFRERYIGTAEAARILGCTRSTLNTLAALGNIRSDCVAHAQDGRYDRWLFDSYALKDWVADRIRVQDAAEILGAHPESVRTWAREGRLTRVSNLWFSRREVTEWRDDRVSTKDAAMLIGVGLQSFIAWVNAGRFTPLAALAHNKWWFFSRKELTRWRAERMTAKEAMAALSIPKYQL